MNDVCGCTVCDRMESAHMDAFGTTIWTSADADGALDLDAILGFASHRRRPRPNTPPMAQKSSQLTDPPRPHAVGKSLPS
jgi:hypothetical protein